MESKWNDDDQSQDYATYIPEGQPQYSPEMQSWARPMSAMPTDMQEMLDDDTQSESE